MLDSLLQAKPCPLCDADDYTVLRESAYPAQGDATALLKAYCSSSDHVLLDQLVRCRRCSLVYLNPRVRDELILRSYAEAVDPTFVQQDALRIRTFRRSLRRLVARQRISPAASTRVLDVGCAGGAFVKAAADLGMSVVGIEPSRWLARSGRQLYDLDIRAGVLADHSFPARHFDLVTLWDVIEHLGDPGAELDAIHRLLKDDGLVVLSFPNYDSSVRKIMGYRWPFFLSVHLVYFTPRTIDEFLDRRGFEPLEASRLYQTLELGYVLRRAEPYLAPAQLLSRAARAARLAHLPFTYYLGQSVLVARKKRST